MTKLQFLLALHDKLADVPKKDAEERLHFYAEMIEDRMEEGLPEEEAVAAVGSVDEIAAQILAEFPPQKPAPEHTLAQKPAPKKRRKAWEIILLILGAPLWLPLLIAAFAVLLSLYVSLWAVIVSLWAIFASSVVCTLSSITAGIGCTVFGRTVAGIALLGAGAVFAGVSVFLFFGCRGVTKGTVWITKRAVCGKRCRAETKEEA